MCRMCGFVPAEPALGYCLDSLRHPAQYSGVEINFPDLDWSYSLDVSKELLKPSLSWVNIIVRDSDIVTNVLIAGWKTPWHVARWNEA